MTSSAGPGWPGRVLVLVVVMALVAGAVLLVRYQKFLDTGLAVADGGSVFVLKEGTSLRRLALELARQDIICCPRFLVWLGRETGAAAHLQSGEYRLTPEMTPPELLEMLVSGAVIQHALAIVEGETFRELLGMLRRSEVLKQTLDGDDPGTVMAQLGLDGEHPEGRFLPDTYYFPAGTTDVAFLRRAHAAMETELAEEWEQRAEGLPLHTPYEALILASIVEKETGQAGERARIAGVFMERLRRGMRLQTDPTVIYGLGETFDGNLRRRDLQVDTSYNTYTREGLPPTPIAMPGRAAIHAVMHPEEHGYLYFVARGDGSHYFSRTLAEHNLAVQKYQLGKPDISLPDTTQAQ